VDAGPHRRAAPLTLNPRSPLQGLPPARYGLTGRLPSWRGTLRSRGQWSPRPTERSLPSPTSAACITATPAPPEPRPPEGISEPSGGTCGKPGAGADQGYCSSPASCRTAR
jgi:hypothetical protein